MTLPPPPRGLGVSRRLSERARAATRAEASQPAASASGDPDITIEGGFAGMVGSLRGLLEQFGRAAQDLAAHGLEAQGRAENDAGEHDPREHADGGMSRTVKLGGRNGRMVFGYTIKMGRDGLAAEPFGNVPAGRSQAASAAPSSPAPAALQPIVDVFEDADRVVVVAELPGADLEAILCHAEGKHLLIEATGARRYRKEMALPVAVRSEGMQQSYRNGILEVRLLRDDAA